MSRCDSVNRVLIAGGGIVGLSIAWRLAQSGCSVTLFDKGLLGGESTWAAAGMLAPGGEFSTASPEANLALESRAAYSGFVRELGQASGEPIDYQECGALELACSDEEWSTLEGKAARQAELGIKSQLVSPRQAATFWPRLDTTRLRGARFYPNDAVADPRDLTRALTAACRRQGVELIENCPVGHIHVGGKGVTLACAGGRQADAAAVVVAAGAWSGAIPITGAPALPPSEPVKGQMIAYRQPAQTCGTILRQGHRYLLQRANGMLIVGASMQRVAFNRDASQDVTNELAAWAASILPHLAETAPTSTWTGLRPAASTLQIGSWHSHRLFLAYGHFRNGILLAPVTAARIANALTSNLETPLGARA